MPIEEKVSSQDTAGAELIIHDTAAPASPCPKCGCGSKARIGRGDPKGLARICSNSTCRFKFNLAKLPDDVLDAEAVQEEQRYRDKNP